MHKIIVLLSLLTFVSCSSLSKNSYNATLDEFKYPFKVHKFKFKSQTHDLEMAYMDIGEKSAKKTYVLLHGKNFSGFYWERIANDLVKTKARVIIPDQIGFGKSSRPSFYQYSFPQLALNTKKLLDSLEVSNPIIIGHSMGGMLATTYAHNYKIKKLILINPIGLEFYGKYAQFKDTDFFYKRELSKTVDKIRNYQKKVYYDGKWSDEYEKLLAPHKGQLAGGDWDEIAWNNALTYGPIFSENVPSLFSNIKVPTSLIIGTRDRTGPGRGWKKKGVKYKLGQYQKLGKKAKRMFPKARLYELKGLGHMPHYENYDRFYKVFKKAI